MPRVISLSAAGSASAAKAVPATFGPIFGALEPLPRGPHTLTRDEVAASQRSRILAGVASAVATHGYADATIAAITQRAGVSPRTFYEHFDDKLDCYLAAYEVFAAALFERIGAALPDDEGFEATVAAGVNAYLSALELEPTVARAFIVEMDAAGSEARRRKRRAYERLAALLAARHEEMRERDHSLGPVPEVVYLAIVHGVRELARDALEEQARPRLTELAPDVVAWMSATARGAALAGIPPA